MAFAITVSLPGGWEWVNSTIRVELNRKCKFGERPLVIIFPKSKSTTQKNLESFIFSPFVFIYFSTLSINGNMCKLFVELYPLWWQTAKWPAFVNKLLLLCGSCLPTVPVKAFADFIGGHKPLSRSFPPSPLLSFCFPAFDVDSLLDTGDTGQVLTSAFKHRGGRSKVTEILLTLKSSLYLQDENKCSPKSPWDTHGSSPTGISCHLGFFSSFSFLNGI